MPSYKLKITEEATIQLELACLYYEKQQKGLGYQFEESIYLMFEYILSNPNLFSIRFANLHEALVTKFPYVIVYEILEKEILITSIFHTKQNPTKKKKQK